MNKKQVRQDVVFVKFPRICYLICAFAFACIIGLLQFIFSCACIHTLTILYYILLFLLPLSPIAITHFAKHYTVLQTQTETKSHSQNQYYFPPSFPLSISTKITGALLFILPKISTKIKSFVKIPENPANLRKFQKILEIPMNFWKFTKNWWKFP